MNSLIENRSMRVFISSTFRDMQDERDYLMKRTFPKLRQLASARDVTLTELDLRWGITEEESKSGKVVDICFREIENSVPFFIGIVGNRYGWVPKKEELDGGIMSRFPSVTDYLEQNLSVSEMEMQFGVLNRSGDMHAFFFIKEQEEEQDNPEMLRRLKTAIQESKYPSSTYSSVEDLSAQVEKAFTTLLNQLFPEENLTEHQKDRLIQRSFINKLSASYVRVEDNFRRLTEFSEDWKSPFLVVTGESGLGKSALLANWSKEMQQNADVTVIPYFSSNGGCQTAAGIMKYLAEEICEQFGIEKTMGAEKDNFEKVLECFSTLPKRLILVFDAINQIADLNQDKMLNWLPYPPNNVKYLFSTLPEDKTMSVFKNRSYPVFCLQRLTEDQKRELIEKYLGSFGKKLTLKQIGRIIRDSQSGNTLVLRTLLDELIGFGDYESLDARIDHYFCGGSVPEFYEKVLERFEQDFGRAFVKKILGLISVSRTGVSEEELIHMTGAKRLEWSDFYCSFATHLNNQSGRFVFTHSYITSTVRKRYLEGDPSFEEECRRTLAKELDDVPSGYARQEVPYQLDCLEDWDALHDYIATFSYLLYGMEQDDLEVGKYWRHILEGRKGKYSLRDYLRLEGDLSPADRSLLFDNVMRLCGIVYQAGLQKEIARMQVDLIARHPELATPDIYLTIASSLGRPDSFTYARKSLDLCRQKGDVQGEIMAYGVLGANYYDAAVKENSDEDAGKAYEMWEKGKDLSIGYYGELHPRVISGYRDMALVCDNDPEKALSLAKKALDLSIAFYGPDHPDDGRSYHYVGVMYRERKEWEKALYYFQQACRVWKPAYGLYHDVMNSSYGNQGKALMNLGRLDEALACYDTCMEIISVIYDNPSYEYAIVMLNRAQIFKMMNKKDAARDACQSSIAALRSEKVYAEERAKELLKRCEGFWAEL